MKEVIFGLVAIGAGALFCFRGFVAFRFVIAVWGAFVGFGLGAGLVAGLAGDGFLATGLGWIVGLALALVFAVLAYLFYALAVVLAMASIGFALGSTLMAALGVSWTWVIVLVGLAFGVLLAVAAVLVDLPLVLVVLLSALAGASAITTGLMILFGTIDLGELDEDAVTARAGDDWWWYVVYFGLAVLGTVSQTRAIGRLRGTLRDAWDGREPA